MNIAASALDISTPSPLAGGTVGIPYVQAFTATGGTGLVVTENAYHGVTHLMAGASPSLGRGVNLGPHVRLVQAPKDAASFAADVTAAFAELRIPIVGPDNARPGLERLEVSLAGRIEDHEVHPWCAVIGGARRTQPARDQPLDAEQRLGAGAHHRHPHRAPHCAARRRLAATADSSAAWSTPRRSVTQSSS